MPTSVDLNIEKTTRQSIDVSSNPMITLYCAGEDMLTVSPKGFFVRGQPVPQDDKEAQAVYSAFKQWLTWAQLNGQY